VFWEAHELAPPQGKTERALPASLPDVILQLFVREQLQDHAEKGCRAYA
jgi:hypothetical protein